MRCSRSSRGRARVVHVCDDIACRCSGALELIAQVEERFGAEGELSDDGAATWYRSPCLGQCDRAPAALLSEAGAPPLERVAAPASASVVLALLAGGEPGPEPVTVPVQDAGEVRLLRRVGHVDPVQPRRVPGERRVRGAQAGVRARAGGSRP